MSTVLVLGAYGDAGRAVVEALQPSGDFHVIAAGRSKEKLEGLKTAGIETALLDVRDLEALGTCLGRAELVINCVGPYIGTGAEIARAAQERGVPYIDIASEQEHYRRLVRVIDPEGPMVLAGAGAYPGLSGLLLQVLLSRFPDARDAELALIAGPPRDPDAGRAQALSAVIELAYGHEGVRGGKRLTVRPGATRSFVFPEPFGAQDVLLWPQLETLVFAVKLDLETHVGLGHAPLPRPWVLQLLSWMRPVPGSLALRVVASFLRHRSAPGAAESSTTGLGAVVARIQTNSGTQVASAVARDLSASTAWLPVLIAERWKAGELRGNGLLHPVDVLDAGATLELAAASAVFEIVVQPQVEPES